MFALSNPTTWIRIRMPRISLSKINVRVSVCFMQNGHLSFLVSRKKCFFFIFMIFLRFHSERSNDGQKRSQNCTSNHVTQRVLINVEYTDPNFLVSCGNISFTCLLNMRHQPEHIETFNQSLGIEIPYPKIWVLYKCDSTKMGSNVSKCVSTLIFTFVGSAKIFG